MLLICSGSWRHWVQKCGFLYSCLYIVYFILPALSGSSHPSPSVGWQPGYIYYDHRGNKKCDQTCANHFLYPHSWARLGAGNRLEIQTEVREDFTITEKAPTIHNECVASFFSETSGNRLIHDATQNSIYLLSSYLQ